VLLAVLSEPLGLSNAQIGTAVTLYMLAGSLSQPLFGWLTDKLPEPGATGINSLHLISLSIVWMAVFFSMVAFTPSWGLIMAFLLLASLGSGLFHPIGTGHVATLKTESTNTWTAVFFLGGQSGLALGPIIGGILFDMVGVAGIVPLSTLALFPAMLMWFSVRNHQAQAAKIAAPLVPQAATEQPDTGKLLLRLLSVTVLIFFALVAMRSSIQAVYQFLIPKLFEDRGWDAGMYGLLAGIFMGMAAIGNVVIGRLADRFGMRLVSVVSLLLSVPVGLLFLTTPSPLLVFVASGLSGMLVGGQHSILVVYAQRLLPVRKGLAAGLILGFTFASGALGTWLCGIAADIYSLQSAMQVVALLGLPAALLALTLPGRERAIAVAPVVEPQPVARG
jgi:FSR family fosmidomycin resistance protein-like MFS transporter